MRMKRLIEIAFILFAAFILSCGDSSSRENTPPVSNAGVDLNRTLGSIVLLDGTGSTDPDGDPLTYQWTFASKPSGSSAALENHTSAEPTFTPDEIGEYVIALVVSDGQNKDESSLKVVVDTIEIYSNDFSSESLDDFIVGEIGTANVGVENGELVIHPGEGYLNRGFVVLNSPQWSDELAPVLSQNEAQVVFAFNISNLDGTVCGSCNNLFRFQIYSDPDPSATTGFGYALMGGGYVGNRMGFLQIASSLSPYGPISDFLLDVPDGLSPLPLIGAFRIVYDPRTNLWQVFYEESDMKGNPLEITTLIGEFTDSRFVGDSLPYIILGGENTQKTNFDNLTVLLHYDLAE